MPNLIQLNLESNNVKDMKPLTNEESFKNLQTLNLAKNKLVELLSIKPPKLLVLNLFDNKIEKAETFEGHPKLKQLSLRKNKLSTLANFSNMPNLKELYLSENRIKVFMGLEGLPSLITLHLRKNLIDTFDENLPNLEGLQYLNFRENRIDKLEEVLRLNSYSTLKTLIISFNSVIGKNPSIYFFEVLNNFKGILRINKINITKLHKEKAIAYAADKYKKEMEEKERLEREAEEKARLEEEAANAAEN